LSKVITIECSDRGESKCVGVTKNRVTNCFEDKAVRLLEKKLLSDISTLENTDGNIFLYQLIFQADILYVPPTPRATKSGVVCVHACVRVCACVYMLGE
jgi:hypothetical protein